MKGQYNYKQEKEANESEEQCLTDGGEEWMKSEG